MKRDKALQGAAHQYKLETGKSEVTAREVAEFAVKRLGMKVPEPKDPLDLLAKQISRALRNETGIDTDTGRPFRRNHAYPGTVNGKQSILWGDIDTMTRKQMHMSLQQRREQMVGDAVQLAADAEHWTNSHPDEDPIQMSFDFRDDILERNAMDDTEAAA